MKLPGEPFPTVEVSCRTCRKSKPTEFSLNCVCLHREGGDFDPVFGAICCMEWLPSKKDILIWMERIEEAKSNVL